MVQSGTHIALNTFIFHTDKREIKAMKPKNKQKHKLQVGRRKN